MFFILCYFILYICCIIVDLMDLIGLKPIVRTYLPSVNLHCRISLYCSVQLCRFLEL